MADLHLALLIDRFMRRIHVALRAKAADFDVERLGPGGAMVLLALADREETGMNELARAMARDKSQMTRIVQALEAKGVVARQASPKDARVSLVTLTARGRAAVGGVQRALAETIDEILGPIDPEERRVLTELMRRVTA